MTRVLLALAIALCVASAAQAADFNIDQNLGFDTFGAKSTGQTFTPSVGITPDPGAVATLDLKEITFYHGNYTAFAPSTTTYLNVYDGDPKGSGQFLGSSTTSLDTTTGYFFHTPMLWSFNNLTLNYTTEYWVIMSSTSTAGSLDVAVSLETHDRNLTAIYTGGSGLIADQKKHTTDVDAKFNIVLTTGAWTNLGNDLPGSLGSPTLSGQGTLSAGNTVTLALGNAAPNSLSGLFIGASSVSLPFYSGIIVPSPDILVVIPTGPAGSYTLSSVYPAGPPSGFPLYFQVWVVDLTGPQGYTATNALTVTTQ